MSPNTPFHERNIKYKFMDINSKIIYQRHTIRAELPFLAGCIVDQYLYFASWLENGFFKLNLETWICTPLKKFEYEEESLLMYDQAIYHNGEMWLIPYHAANIVKINLHTLNMLYIPLPSEGTDILNDQGKRVWRFKCCYDGKGERLWLIPIGYNIFLSLDMKTNQIEKIKNTEEINFEIGKINFIDACMKENEIWLCPYDNDKLVIYNLEKKILGFHKWKYTNERFSCIKNYKNWMIFIPQRLDKYILLVEKNTFEEKKIFLNINWEKKEDPMYRIANIKDDYLFLAPFFAKEYISINLKNGEVKSDTSYHECSQTYRWNAERYQSSFTYGTKIIYISDKSEAPLMIYDFAKNKFCFKYMHMNLKEYIEFYLNFHSENKKDILRRIQSREGVYLERKLPIILYCDLINDLLQQSNQGNCNKFGKKIFNYING